MREADWTEWLNNPATKALQVFLRQRRAPTVQSFLAGAPVQPVDQGRAAASYELETLLTSPANEVKQILENALREPKNP